MENSKNEDSSNPSATSTPAIATPRSSEEALPKGNGKERAVSQADLVAIPARAEQILDESHEDQAVDQGARQARPALKIDFADHDDNAANNDQDGNGEQRIVDDSFEPDFDFSMRKNRPNRLTKAMSFRPRTPAGISPQTPRRSDSSSSSRSFGDRISSLLAVAVRPSSPKPKSPKTPTPSTVNQEIPLDELPDTKAGLEGRLNYHLAELGTLKRQVTSLNDGVRSQVHHLNTTSNRVGREMPRSVLELQKMLMYTRSVRDGHQPFVRYHREEMKRIARKRIELDEAAGVEPKLPEVMSGLDNDYDWLQLFLA